jgi:FkbM family methyltransferase
MAWYFLGAFTRRLTGIRLFDHLVLHFNELRCYADVDGGCGLVFLYEIWVKKTYDAILPSLPQTPEILFDVGANCGFFGLRRCLQNPDAQVFCFEPHPKTFGVLQRNVTLNALSGRARAVQCAVGAVSGMCQIEVDASSSMAVLAQGDTRDARGSSTVAVPMISLDEDCHEHRVWPDALKIDVEGFEVEVLSGATECLARTKRLVLEYHSEALRARCLKILEPRFRTRAFGSLIYAEAPDGPK